MKYISLSEMNIWDTVCLESWADSSPGRIHNAKELGFVHFFLGSNIAFNTGTYYSNI